MANLSLKNTTQLMSMIPRRLASTASQSKPEQKQQQRTRLMPQEPVKVTKLGSGVVVASLENNSPITRIAAVVNSGSRDENLKEKGASHALRVFSGLATKNYSQFGVSRTLNQIGAELAVKSSREQTTYLLESTRDTTARAVDILGEIISRPELRRWEIHDSQPRFLFDLDVYDETAELRLADMIHAASFRGVSGLASPLFAPRYNLQNSGNSDVLRGFRARTFTLNRLQLIGVGIGHDDLCRYAESSFRLPTGSAESLVRPASSFLNNGELREESCAGLVHVALASQGASLASGNELLVSRIVSSALGTGPRIKHSSGSSRLAKAIAPVASQTALATTFNANYSDAGLFGLHIVAQAADIGKVTKALIAEINKVSKSGLTAQEITNAKNSLKATLALANECSHNIIDSLAQNPNAKSLDEVLKSVDLVSANDINTFLKKIAGSKKSLAAIGDLSNLPRLDELSE
jgi:ubiquinol-cytochrome c reductase core subunit 2